ncbi:MAG TPA: hypothetical protein VM222_02310 [Planctomycetota bacterium]|nr:hypothetical protein [Planctomycetota bacterium]
MPDELVSRLEAALRQKDPQGSVTPENDGYLLSFSELGAPQELRLQAVPPSSWTLLYTSKIPGAKERWFLESKSVWFPEHPGCSRLEFEPLADRYKVYASDDSFFRSVFDGHRLAEFLLQFPAEDHVQASLKDGALTISRSVRLEPGSADRDAVLLDCADAMVRLGSQCFKSVQVARLTRGEATG